MTPQNRRTILINKEFQIKFIIYTLLPGVLIQLSLWLSLEYALNVMIKKGEAANLPSDHFYYQLISEQLGLMKTIFAVTGILSFLIICIWALFISHKIAGPFFRLTNMLKNKDENLKNVKFRPGDFFPEVADALSDYLKNKKD